MSEEKRELTVREAGALGGKKRAEELGPEGFAALGRKGGAVTKERYGPDYYARIGAEGGRANYEKNGPEYYVEIGKRGGKRVRELIARAKALEGVSG